MVTHIDRCALIYSYSGKQITVVKIDKLELQACTYMNLMKICFKTTLMTYFPQRRLAEYKINIQKSIAERKTSFTIATTRLSRNKLSKRCTKPL